MPTSTILGTIQANEFDPDICWSEPVAIPYFDGLKIRVGIAEAGHQPSLESADAALENFLKLTSDDRKSDSEMVHQYYAACLKFGITEPLDIVEKHDIWNFVRPSEIIVDSLMNEGFFVTISCRCAWEEEHGLQLEFKHGRELVRASGHE